MNICLKINYSTSNIKALLRPPASAPDLSYMNAVHMPVYFYNKNNHLK